MFINWIPPIKNEPLRDYALRLKDSFIPDDAILVGLSFGGMLATEIAKEYPLIKTFLISSSKTKFELPAYYRTGKYFPLHNWCSPNLQRWFMKKIKSFFGINSAGSQKIYEELIKNSDTHFNRWAINAIINWNNTQVPENIFHIHGTHDLVLPYRYVKCNYTLKKGGHLMVMEQAEIISQLLLHQIATNNIKPSSLSSSIIDL